MYIGIPADAQSLASGKTLSTIQGLSAENLIDTFTAWQDAAPLDVITEALLQEIAVRVKGYEALCKQRI